MKRSHSNTRLARSRCLPTLKPSTRVVPVGVPRCIFDVVSRRSWDGRSPSPFHAFSFFFISTLIRRMTFFIYSNIGRGSVVNFKVQGKRVQLWTNLAQRTFPRDPFAKEWNEDLWREVWIELNRDHRVYGFVDRRTLCLCDLVSGKSNISPSTVLINRTVYLTWPIFPVPFLDFQRKINSIDEGKSKSIECSNNFEILNSTIQTLIID